MSDLIPLKYCLYTDLDRQVKPLVGGGNLAEFIPYSDHYKMEEEGKIAKPLYCPDTHPFLCNQKSKATGLCRRTEHECNRSVIPNDTNRVVLEYKLQTKYRL